ncbi:Thiol-disulfide oxidoreductase DCC isoform 1 [Hibiscus syriacus]|uniref:RHOMBOID-like protein n=1 Tax=Hibiscus syriacus TaxID=106335 RepID=A0A6A3CB02_HIBSY|nr:Thiol-disulfide oxidoreductase DCC isoform 1 [Hibiscus syriacus]
MGQGRTPPSSSSSPTQDIENRTANEGPQNEREMPPPPPAPEPWTPWLMSLVFVADVAVFVYTMYVNDCPHTSGPENCLWLKKLGALDWKLVVEDKEYWRLVSCMWYHAGVIHLAVNMMSLLFLGIRLEQEFGFLRIGPLYMISGLGGSLASALSQGRKKTISVGASGALFGLLGAMLSELITNWSNYTNKCSALSTMVLIICLNLAVGFLPQVDNSAHIGGFISGLLAGFVLLIRPQFEYISPRHVPEGYRIKHKVPKHRLYQYVLFGIALVLLIIGFAVGLERLLAGKTI